MSSPAATRVCRCSATISVMSAPVITPASIEVAASAAVPNIYVKVSGFHYVSARSMGSSLAGRLRR